MAAERKTYCVVGGVGGGAGAAARLRRLDENAEVIIFERGPFVSFANCGLPYHIGNVIPSEPKLLVSSPGHFACRFNIDCRVHNNVLKIDREKQVVHVQNVETKEEYEQHYDALVLSPGARPIKPPLPGLTNEGVFSLRTIPDTRKIRTWLDKSGAKNAVIVGGGFIGLEMAENLVERGLNVTVVEMLNQVMAPLDLEMANIVQNKLKSKGIRLVLGDGLSSIGDDLTVTTQSGMAIPADMVVLSIGVLPENTLAKEAGLDLGVRGTIAVNDQMMTTDPHIYAVGDAIQTDNFVAKTKTHVPLAGPANRQGRCAANNICGVVDHFRGVQGTAVCGMFNLSIACTGMNEKFCKSMDIPYKTVHLHPLHHVKYYPDPEAIHLKVVFDPETGEVLGAQAVGHAGVEKRIDIIATHIQYKGKMANLAEAELCYAPQFGAAKDPVNLAGMMGENILSGVMKMVEWEEALAGEGIIVDVRNPREDEEEGTISQECMKLPLCWLRRKEIEMPKDKPIYLMCREGQRAYYAMRFLAQKGYDSYVINGGYVTYCMKHGLELPINGQIKTMACFASNGDHTVEFDKADR